MRRGNQNKTIHRAEDGTLIGVNLGADFCAEHEWGIDGIKSLFGIDDEAEGLARRKVQRIPSAHMMFDAVTLKTTDYSGPKRKTTKATWWGQICFTYPRDIERVSTLTEEVVSSLNLTPYGEDEITGAWDGRSWGFLVKNAAVAREMSDAIDRLDLCIGLFNGEAWNPFSRAGLGLLIASRLPAEVTDGWLEKDRDARRLQKASADTGIADRLKDAGIKYFALSPRWLTDLSFKTKHPVIYWLNPREQQANNHGWFTVEDLDKWIEGKGPVPKKQKERA